MGCPGTEVSDEHARLVWHYVMKPIIERYRKWQLSVRPTCPHDRISRDAVPASTRIVERYEYECERCGQLMKVEPKT